MKEREVLIEIQRELEKNFNWLRQLSKTAEIMEALSFLERSINAIRKGIMKELKLIEERTKVELKRERILEKEEKKVFESKRGEVILKRGEQLLLFELKGEFSSTELNLVYSLFMKEIERVNYGVIVIIDMEKLRQIDSILLGILVALDEKISLKNGNLVISDPPSFIVSFLKRIKMEARFPIIFTKSSFKTKEEKE